MDGTNNSLVTSAVPDWLCTSSFGCSPDSTEAGVFGGGPGASLWDFPVTSIDFAGITVDLVEMRDRAQLHGLYFPTLGGDEDRVGYRFEFLSDGTFDAYEVTNTAWVWAYHSSDASWHREYDIITGESFIDNFSVPSDCGLVFASGKVWLEGVIDDKVTVVAANVEDPGVDVDMVVYGNVTYTSYDGSVGFTAVAEDSLTIPLIAPDDMEMNGIFIAQLGNFGRHYYTTSGFYDVPFSLNGYVLRDRLTVNGTIVSNGRVGTKWSCGGVYCSGYDSRVNTYDRDLALDPPPLTPYVSDEYRFIEWLEVE
jgi:hypothetical protein